MKIEWASNYAPDGSRRTPPASTIHGWLAKWRGTLSGNEHLRDRGMAEMRKAASYRRARKIYERKKAEKGGTSTAGLLSFLRGTSKASSQTRRLSSRSKSRSTRPPKSPRTKDPQSPPGRRLTSRRTESKSSTSSGRAKQPSSRTHPKAKPQGPGTRRPHGRT